MRVRNMWACAEMSSPYNSTPAGARRSSRVKDDYTRATTCETLNNSAYSPTREMDVTRRATATSTFWESAYIVAAKYLPTLSSTRTLCTACRAISLDLRASCPHTCTSRASSNHSSVSFLCSVRICAMLYSLSMKSPGVTVENMCPQYET